MQYMMLIYGDESARAAMSDTERQADLAKWIQYTEEMRAAGVMVAGDALHFSDTATSVRVREGKTLVTDGPFAETKEVLGGYYLLEVPGIDEATAWAAKCPAAPYGTLELRPVMVFDGPGG